MDTAFSTEASPILHRHRCSKKVDQKLALQYPDILCSTATTAVIVNN